MVDIKELGRCIGIFSVSRLQSIIKGRDLRYDRRFVVKKRRTVSLVTFPNVPLFQTDRTP